MDLDFKYPAIFNKPIGKGAVLCLSQTWLPITENINRIPVYYL